MPSFASHPPSRVQTLDALRGIAVLAVFIYHMTTSPALVDLFSPLAKALLSMGGLGVELFYVLSGYFITKSVLGMRTFDQARFLKARVSRIYPAYLVCLAVSVGVAVAVNRATPESTTLCLLLHLLMLHNIFPGVASLFNGVFWTLGVEFPYYLFMMAVGGLLRSPRGFWWTTAFMVACAWVFRACVFYFIPPDSYAGLGRFFFATQMPGALDLFAAGGVACMLTGRWREVPAWGRQIVFWAGVTLSLALIWLALKTEGAFWTNRFMATYWRTLLALGFGALVVAGVWMQPGAWLGWSGLPWLGKISFSVYLWHYPVIELLTAQGQGLPLWMRGLTTIVLTLLVSWASWRWVESRFHNPAPQAA